jgi:hypothetical protein
MAECAKRMAGPPRPCKKHDYSSITRGRSSPLKAQPAVMKKVRRLGRIWPESSLSSGMKTRKGDSQDWRISAGPVLRFGDLVAAVYENCGKASARGILRLAINTHLVEFRRGQRFQVVDRREQSHV